MWGGACLAGWDKILAFSETLLWRAPVETYLKYQEESGEDFEDTKKAIEIVSSATRDSNKGLREKEMMERMKKLQLRCEPFQLIQAGRHLLREGELHNVNNWEVAFLIILKDAFLSAGSSALSCHPCDWLFFSGLSQGRALVF